MRGKKWAGPFLPHPQNQLKAKGEKEIGRPVSSPPSKPSESKILTVLCYQLYLVLISKKELIGHFLPHLTTKHSSGLTNYCFWGGEEMGRPVSSPPSKPSESKILTVLCYQLYLVLISKIELIGHFLPHLTTKHSLGLTNYCLGGGKKWGGPFLPHPQNQVKAKYS